MPMERLPTQVTKQAHGGQPGLQQYTQLLDVYTKKQHQLTFKSNTFRLL